MSEIRGPLSAVGAAVAHVLTYQPRPKPYKPPKPPPTPAEQALSRAMGGAGFFTACCWLSPVMWRNFAGPLLQSPQNAPVELWLPLAVWGVVGLMAWLYLVVGIRDARWIVPQNFLAACWCLLLLIGMAVLFGKRIYPPGEPAGYIVRGVYVTGFAVGAMYFWIASGLGSSSARRIIKRLLKRRNALLRPARRRRWFFFW